MKDTKFYPLLAISIVLLLASFILLCILGYNFYTKPQTAVAITAKNNISSVNNTTRDSLQKVYTATVNKFQVDSKLDSALTETDSLKQNLDSKLSGFYSLRNEIATLLKGNSSVADLTLAKQKIDELQLKVDELRNRNVDIENENRRLNAILAQFATNTNNNATFQNSASTNSARPVIEKTNAETSFVATDLRLAANDENAVEVTDAEQTEKFVGSFVVKNITTLNNAELMVVVIQPDGRVLKNAWESGSFETNEGKKIYSRKIQFDYNKGEAKKLNFSLSTDNGQKGNYTMLLYNKGKVIGKTVKTIS